MSLSRTWHFDREGNPLDWERWAELVADREYCRIGSWGDDDDEFSPWVSTVWLGINHNFIGEGLPLIFETMIFGGPFSHLCTRYATEAQAIEGHQRTVADLEAGRTPWFVQDEFHPANSEGRT